MGRCKSCGEVEKPCTETNTKICGCSDKVDLLCTYYSGDNLDTIGIEKNMNGNLVIQILAEYIKTAFENLDQDSVILDNIGDGVKVYKGYSNEFIHEFKSLVQKDGVKIVETEETLEFSVDEEWVKTLIENHLKSGNWFSTFIQNLFNTNEFKDYFAQYITNLITGGAIDICSLIQGCLPPPTNNPPIITGDIIYDLPNRAAPVDLDSGKFLNKYYDPEGDDLVAIRITGGNLSNMTYSGTPINVGLIIPISEISHIKFNVLNQDAAYTQNVTYVGINEIGQETN